MHGNQNIHSAEYEYLVWEVKKSRLSKKDSRVVLASSSFQARKREAERRGISITELAALRKNSQGAA